MGDILSSLNVHCVFGTKNREPLSAQKLPGRICQFLKKHGIALKNDIFGIDRAVVFGRPSGTQAERSPGPGDKSLGYCHMSLRDVSLSQLS